MEGVNVMSEYIVEIEGKYPIAQIEKQIQSEELGFSQFISITIGHYRNIVTNLATFKELPAGTTPKQPTLVEAVPGQAPAAGKLTVWSGPMLAGGKAIYAALYRDA
jgi:hypothetical protein